jgi:VCBS repeat-containing protein
MNLKNFIVVTLVVIVVLASCNKEVKNQAPTNISLSNLSISENETIGTLVGEISVTDLDTDDNHTLSILTEGEYFSLDDNKLISNVSFDYEYQENYTITINANDGNGGTFNKDFTINITNQNDNPLIGTWRYETATFWFQYIFNSDLTGNRTDFDNEDDDFTYTYTNDKVNFTSGFPNGEYDYEIVGNALIIFGDTLIRQ